MTQVSEWKIDTRNSWRASDPGQDHQQYSEEWEGKCSHCKGYGV